MQRLLILLAVFVFLLSGIAVSEAAYQDHGNGTVTDTATGLMWQKSAPSDTMTWRQALDYCESLSLGGHTDWRMPTIKELKSLVDHSRYNPAINTTYFPGTVASWYWSSSTSASLTYNAWVVVFSLGGDGSSYNKTDSRYVRAVRGGQSGSFGNLVISIEPAEARAAGAQWRRTGTTTWRNSGTTENNVPVGSHTVEFKAISGWTKPASITVTITRDQTTSATGTYVREITQHTVTATAGTGGSVTPSSRTVNHGSTTTFTVTPNSGHTHSTVGGTCPAGSFSGNTYTTGSITANCTVIFSFTQTQHTVTATAGSGGSVTPSSRTVNHGSTTTFTVTPNSGHTHSTVGGTCPAGSFSGNTYTTGAITSACSVSFSFTLKQYTVTPSAGAHGSISPNTPQTVNHGDTPHFTVTPDAGYGADVGGTCGGTLDGNTYTTTPVTANCTVVASFTPHENRPPVARVREQQVFLDNMGDMAILDASESSDPDGDVLFFSWREDHRNPHHGLIPTGADSLPVLYLSFPAPGRYAFSVRVSDGELMSEQTRTITVYVPGVRGLIGYTPSNALVRVPDAVVRVHNSAADAQNNVNPVDLAISDSLGRYVLENLAPENDQAGRNYYALVERSGFTGTEILTMSVRPDPGFEDGWENYHIGRGHVTAVAGTVRTPGGAAIENALASIMPGTGGEPFAHSTDETGRFVLNNVPRGAWIMQLRATGFQPEVRDVTVAEGMPELNFTLRPATGTGTLTGTVFLAGTDRPVPGARVTLGTGAAVDANPQGIYEFSRIPVGDYILTVTRSGFAPQRMPMVPVRSGTTTLDLSLSYAGQGPMVYGTVSDAESGAPVRLATVGAVGTAGLLVRSDISDYTGFYQILDMPTGEQTFRVSAPGYVTRTVSRNVTAGMEMNITLARGGNWAPPVRPGRNTPEARVGEPFIFLNNLNQGATLDARPSLGENLVYIWRENPNNPMLNLLPSDSASQSTIRISGFRRPGIYIFELQVVRGGVLSANTAAITVFAPGLTGNVHASPSDGIIGLSAVTVRAYAQYDDAKNWTDNLVESTQTDESPPGNFALQGLSSGRYWVVARAQSGTGYLQYGPTLRRVNHGRAARNLPINLPREEYNLNGIVRDARTRTPLENVRLVVAPGSLSESYRTTTNAQGQYYLSMVPAGQAQPVMLMRDGYKTLVVTLSINGDMTRDISLEPDEDARPATLSGRVVADFQGILLPVYNAEIIIGSGLAQTFTDADGRYTIANLPPGQYYGTIRKPGYVPRGLADFGFTELEAGPNIINKVLSFAAAGPVIRGTVINEQQEPIPGVTIRILDPSPSFATWASSPEAQQLRAEIALQYLRDGTQPTRSQTPQSDAGGIFQIPDLPHGHQQIEARLPDGRILIRTINVDGNQQLVLEEGDFRPEQSWTLTYTAGPGGRIDGTTPQTVAHGQDGTPVTAMPNTEYHFVKWSDGLTTAHRLDRNVTRDISVNAEFAENRDVIVTVTAGTSGGRVEDEGSNTYRTGDLVTLRAIPDAGYMFSHWTLNGEPVAGARAVYTFIVTDDMHLVAHFKKVKGLPGVLMLLLGE